MSHKFFLCLFFSLCVPVLKIEAAQNILTSLQGSIDRSQDAEVTQVLKITRSLITLTQDLIPPSLIKKHEESAFKILSYFEGSMSHKESLLQLLQIILNDLSPIYAERVIGAPSDEASNSTKASIFSQVKLLQPQLDASVFSEVWVNLIGLSQKYRPQGHSLTEMVHFYQTVGFYDPDETLKPSPKPSLLQCIQTRDSIGTLENKDSENSFLSIVQDLIQTDASDKIALIQSLLGSAQNSRQQYSILGNINDLATLASLSEAPISSSFIQKLIGQNEFRQIQQDHTRSLFSHLYETSSLVNHLLTSDPQYPNLNALIEHIGVEGDKTDASLFGALHLLKDSLQKFPAENSFNNFDKIFGVSEPRLPTSCWGHAFSLRKEILHFTTTNWSQNFENCLPYLYYESIQKIKPFLKTGNASDEEEITKIILDDVIMHLKSEKESSILFQLKILSQSVRGFPENAYIADRIGMPDESGIWPEFSLGSQIYRLTQDIEDSKKTDNSSPFSSVFRNNCLSLYQVFFECANSVQSKLYEIEARRTHKNKSFANLIGSILSRDSSIFGLVNQKIKIFEVDLILEKIGPKESPAQEDGTILQKLKSFHENFNPENLKDVEDTVGTTYKAYSPNNDTLINVIAYFHDVFENTFQILPRQKIMTYARSIYQMESGNLKSLVELTSQIMEEKKEDSMKALSSCGSISNKEGKTLWASVNTILNGLYSDILGLVTQQNSTPQKSSSSKNMEGLIEQLSQKLLEQTPPIETTPLAQKISNLKSFIGLSQKNHLRFSLVDFACNLFGTFQPEPTFTNFSELDQQNTQDNAPIGLFETILTTFPDIKITPCGSPDDTVNENSLYGKLNQLLYAIISKPLLAILENDGVSDNEGKGLEKLLKHIKKEIQTHPEIIVEWGGDDEDLTEENIENAGIMTLFNEVLRLFSTSHLTLSAITYQKLLFVLGTCYDLEKDSAKRSLFSTVNFIETRLSKPEYISEIQTTIGLPKDNASSSYKSLYQNLNSIFDLMIPDQKRFIFYDALEEGKSTQDSGVLKNLHTIYSLLQQPCYFSLDSFQEARLRLGTPSKTDPTGLFKKLQQKLETFDNTQFERLFQETRPAHSFILFSKLLQKSTFDFIQNLNSKNPSAELDFFEHAIENLFSFGSCAGCKEINYFITEIDFLGQDAIKNLKSLSTEDWFSILKVDSFSPFQKQLESFNSALLLFSNQLEKENDTHCLLSESTQSLQEVRNQFGNLAQAFRSIWEPTKKMYPFAREFVPTEKTDCPFMQENLESLGKTIKGISEQIIIPKTPLILSETQNLKIFQEMSATLTNIRGLIIKIFKINQCSGCLVESIKITTITNGITSLIHQTDELQNFLNISSYAAFFRDFHNVSRALKRIAQNFNYSLQPNQLTDALNRGNVGAALSCIAENFSKFPNIIEQITHLYLKEGPTSGKLNDQMVLCKEELENLYKSTLLLNQSLSPQLLVYEEEEEEDFSQYNMETIVYILQSMLSSSDQFYSTWKSLRIASETMATTREDLEIIPALQDLTQHYENVITSTTPLAQKNFIDPWGVFNLARFQIFTDALAENLEKTKQCFQVLKINFSKHCITSYTCALDAVMSSLTLFAQYLKALLPHVDLTDPAFATCFLPEIITILQSSADFLNVTEKSPKKNCLHISLTQECFRFSQELTQSMRFISSKFVELDLSSIILEDTTSLIPGNSLDIKIQNIALQLGQVFEGLRPFSERLPSLQFCSNQLLSNLRALRLAYGTVQDALETSKRTFVGKELCLYNLGPTISKPSWEKLIQAIQEQKNSTFESIVFLEKNMDCLKKIQTIVSKISQTAHSLATEIETHFQSDTPLVNLLGVRNKPQAVAWIDNLRKTVISINFKIEELVLFFQNATSRQSCIADIEPYTHGIQQELETVKTFFLQLLQISGAPIIPEEKDLSSSVLMTLSDLQNISQTLSVFTQTLNFDDTIDDPTIPSCLFFLTQEISNTSSALLTLFGTLQKVKSEFLFCAKNLSNITAFIQKLALTTQKISLTLQNIVKKMENSIAKNVDKNLISTILLETNVLPDNLNLVDWFKSALKEKNTIDCDFEQLRKKIFNNIPIQKLKDEHEAAIQKCFEL